LVWIGIPFLLFPIAEQYVASSVAGMINAGVPVFTVIFATALLHRLPGRTQMIGLLVGLAGVAIVTIPSAGEGSSSALGVALLVVAVALYGLAINLAVPLQQRYGGLTVALRTQVTGLVWLSPAAIWGIFHSEWAWSSFGAVAALGIAGTGLALLALTVVGARGGAAPGSGGADLVPP